MTTMKNIITKSATSSYKKVVCILLAVSMVLSLAACTNGNDNKESVSSTSESISPVPTQPDETKPIESSVAPTEETSETPSEIQTMEPTQEPTAEPTQEPTTEEPTQKPADGKYTYTIYGAYEVTMDVNIEDYIVEVRGNKYFKLWQLAFDCGWDASGWNTSVGDFVIYDKDDPEAHKAIKFVRNDGFTTVLSLSKEVKDDHLRLIGFSSDFTDVDSSFYRFDDYNTQSDVSVHFYEPGGDYRLSGNGCEVSYDDIVLLAYVTQELEKNPGLNPIWAIFGENHKTHSPITYNDVMIYSL